MTKPSHAELMAFEEGMKVYVAKVSAKAKTPTMTVSRYISKGPMQVSEARARARLREQEQRQKELAKKPQAVRKE